jgi:hypothetical protein
MNVRVHTQANTWCTQEGKLCKQGVIIESSRPMSGTKSSVVIYTTSVLILIITVGRNCVVAIASRYGFVRPGIESRWGRDFPHPSRPALDSTQPNVQWVQGVFPGGKAAGAWCWLPIPSSANVTVRVPFLWALMVCYRVKFICPFTQDLKFPKCLNEFISLQNS